MANNNPIIVNNQPLGVDIIRNGLFGESSLTPAGTFPNTPNYFQYNVSSDSSDKITLTLQKVKDGLKQQLAQQNNTSIDETSDQLVDQFLSDFVSLLIDYRDLRNYVFFGSAYTELSYNIKFLVDNYPYEFLVSTLTTSLNTPSAEFTTTYDPSINQTVVLFKQSAIKDGIEQFNFYDNNIEFNWLNYDILDNNGARYPILKVITPYTSSTIFNITNISSYAVTPSFGTPYTTLKLTTNHPHNYLQGQGVNIFENLLQNTFTNAIDQTLDGNYIVSQVISATEFLIVSKYAVNQILSGNMDLFLEAVSIPSGYNVYQNGEVRLVPYSMNPQPYTIKMVVTGNFSQPEYVTYEDINTVGYSGFLMAPKESILIDFSYNLTPIQNMLLSPSPINPTPWPRRQVTNNIQNLVSASSYNSAEQDFIDWLQSSTNSYVPTANDTDQDISFSDPYGEYKLSRALTLDESETNQLLRRCIPADLISEINDTPNALFQRFILIAGWFFDQIRVYIQFIKYVHHINYGDFNQLSPEYYKLYADYYGFDLFDDDNIDFSKLVVQTEPGFYFISPTDNQQDANNKYYQKTLQQLQYEREKRLLLSLFYLYKSKGTAGTISKLVSLLGAPDGFLVFTEYTFDIQNTDSFDYFGSVVNSKLQATGKRTINNDKVFVPKFHFEIDPDYPVTNNMPPVYRKRLHNESEVNLRVASVQTNPNGAVDSQIINVFGSQKYNYIKFQNGEFATLENLNSNYTVNSPYYFLPLTIPDKFRGITVEFMIPKDGYTKGVGNNLDEVSIHLCSLFQIPNENVGSLVLHVYSYPLPEVYANFDYASLRTISSSTIPRTDGQPNVVSDFNILNRYFQDPTVFTFTNPYIIVRLEGKDLVVRCKINKETTSGIFDIGERVAIAPNIFESDGLNHTLRLQFRPEGVEIYEDYNHIGIATNNKIGIALWLDPTTSPDGIPYCAFEIPKVKIPTLLQKSYDASIFIGYPDNITGFDTPKCWDMFIGMPSNIDFFFKRIEISENYAADGFDIASNIINSKNFTNEYYSFNVVDNDGDIIDFSIRSTFSIMVPNIVPANYSYILPVEEFNNKVVIQNLSLSPKTLIVNSTNQPLQSIKYFIQQQDFFLIQSDIFAENAWSKNLHKNYNYSFFNKVSQLYQLYSPQVLTYDLLSDFLDLIENKFQSTIKNFIPIVINISEFGRLIASSMFDQDKVHYPNIEKFCTATIVGRKAILQERIYDPSTNIQQGVNLTLSFINQNSTNFIGPYNILWQGTVDLTLNLILNTLRSTISNPFFQNMTISLSDGLLAMTIDANWYYNTYPGGLDPNQVQFIVSDGTNTYSKSFQHATPNPVPDDCAFIEYRLPNRPQSTIFIYYKSEDQPKTYIHYKSENSSEKTYINFAQ